LWSTRDVNFLSLFLIVEHILRDVNFLCFSPLSDEVRTLESTGSVGYQSWLTLCLGHLAIAQEILVTISLWDSQIVSAFDRNMISCLCMAL
jgi:hypothetical protein